MKIRTKIERLKKKISDLNISIKNIQDNECFHDKDVTVKYCGNTGNWSKTDDSYWMEWVCLDCGKRWNTDQDREAFQRELALGKAVKRI